MPERRITIDHITLGVSDLERSRRFYTAALEPLGMYDAGTLDDGTGDRAFGHRGAEDFVISERYPVGQVHVAFAAETREEVHAFYEAALAAGGRDNGPPGPRLEYSEGYYGAFVLDPDGHNVEAVFHP